MRKSIFPLLSWTSFDEKVLKSQDFVLDPKKKILCVETDYLLVRRVHASANVHDAVFAGIIGRIKALNLVWMIAKLWSC